MITTRPRTSIPVARTAATDSSLVGLHRTSGPPDPRVKQLQQWLIAFGYLPVSVRASGGFGHFGPQTESAVRAFQFENGLPRTGALCIATAIELREPRPRPASAARGAALAYRPLLGLPVSAPVASQGG